MGVVIEGECKLPYFLLGVDTVLPQRHTQYCQDDFYVENGEELFQGWGDDQEELFQG